MKSLILVLACCGGAAAFHHGTCLLSFLDGGGCESAGPCQDLRCQDPATDTVPDAGGTYVEARSVTVFAGACHYNSEVQSQGRQALLGWSFDVGSFDGVSLVGCAVAAAVSSDANLQEGAARRSVVYLDAPDASRRAALVGWLHENASAVLGKVLETRDADVEVGRTDAAFVLRAGDGLLASGATLADLSCCTMPENRWYEPLGSTAGQALVGESRDCTFDGAQKLPAWTYADANNAFVARFGAPAPASSGCCAESSREALSE